MEPQHPAFDSEEQAILSQIVADEELSQPEPGAATQATAPESAAPAEAAAPAALPEPAPAVEAPASEPPQGDKSAALRAARRAERQLRGENQRLRDELEQARQGKAPVDTAISNDELAELQSDFPVQYKLLLRQRELEAQIAATRTPAQAATPEFQPVVFEDPEVQELVDQVPDLLAWQHDPAAQDKFARAVAYDQALQRDPDWQGKPLLERFAEATERTKRALGVTKPAPVTTRIDPAAVIAAAPATGPKGISDFKGGAPAPAPAIDFTRMSDEEIMARLPVTD